MRVAGTVRDGVNRCRHGSGRAAWLCIAIAAMPGWAGAQSAAAALDKPLDPPVLVKTGYVRAFSDAGIFVAKDLGYFRDEGIEVEMVNFKAAPEAIPFLSTGQVLVSGMAVNPGLFNALNQGINLKIVADKGQVNKNSHWAAIVVRKDLEGKVKSFKDLKGLKIGVPAKGTTSFTELVYAMDTVGLTVKDADIVELSFPNMVTALANKGIDAATVIEPFIALSVGRNIAFTLKEVQDFYPYKAENGIIVYSEQFQRDKPEAAKRWMVAYLRGIRTYLAAMSQGTDREKIIDILAKNTGIEDRTLYAQMAPVGFDPNGRLDAASVKSDHDWAVKLGLMEKPADLEKAIDYSWADYAAKQLSLR